MDEFWCFELEVIDRMGGQTSLIAIQHTASSNQAQTSFHQQRHINHGVRW